MRYRFMNFVMMNLIANVKLIQARINEFGHGPICRILLLVPTESSISAVRGLIDLMRSVDDDVKRIW